MLWYPERYIQNDMLYKLNIMISIKILTKYYDIQKDIYTIIWYSKRYKQNIMIFIKIYSKYYDILKIYIKYFNIQNDLYKM